MLTTGIILAMNLTAVGVSASQVRRFHPQSSSCASHSVPGRFNDPPTLLIPQKDFLHMADVVTPATGAALALSSDDLVEPAYWDKVSAYMTELGPFIDDPIADEPEPVI